MDQTPKITAEGELDGVVPYKPMTESDQFEPESDQDAAQRGPDESWQFWDKQIQAALTYEKRWRKEAERAEASYFGPDEDTDDSDETTNKITDKVALIHSNIDVLKPLLFSETPQPVVRRRFRGDGETDETDIMAAEVGQRLAQYILETQPFDKAMFRVRDDWLLAGRGVARVHYRADISTETIEDPVTRLPVQLEIKTDESVRPQGKAWRTVLLAPCDSWEEMPWIAFETKTSRSTIEKRFGKDVAADISFTETGLVSRAGGLAEADRTIDQAEAVGMTSETSERARSPFDTVPIWEIWIKESREVVWWSPAFKERLLDRQPDPLGLELFWPMPEPLLATTKGDTMTPRPDIAYYERRAKEIEVAGEKLAKILDTLSISGLIPGDMKDEIAKLFDGKNKLIPIAAWLKFMEKGGTNNIVQWLPIDAMIKAAQALITMREQAKQAMFEASGVSDVMRAQGDPNETATAQQIKGRYAGLRLSDRQRRIAIYARDLLRLMVEIGLEHFDTETIADITGLKLPMTELERQAMLQQQAAADQEYEQAVQAHQMLRQAVETGRLPPMPLPPEPQKPDHKRVPETSWELVHERLRSDYGRKITITIETQSTVLVDEQADKEARVEFLGAFASFVQQLQPLIASRQFDMKTVKELLMFGVRGFPKSRTLEGMIAALPDEPQGEAPEDTQVIVAKIKAKIDKELAEMEMKNHQADREHEMKMKGAELVAEAAEKASEPVQQPVPAQ